MAIKYRYENHNPFPIALPGKGGASVTFRSGEGSTDSWYSRFCGPRQLTRVPIAGTRAESRPLPAPAVPEPALCTQPQPMLDRIGGVAEETTKGWTKKQGIYCCTYCELFRTGSRMAMVNHLASYHQLDLRELGIDESGKPVPEEASAETPEEPVEAPEEDPAETEEKPAETPEEPVRTPVVNGVVRTPEVFTCPHCERKYKTQIGLEKHVAREHTTEITSDTSQE